jgi:hypothetical protein
MAATVHQTVVKSPVPVVPASAAGHAGGPVPPALDAEQIRSVLAHVQQRREYRRRLGVATAWFLAAELCRPLLGVRLDIDLYARNGFRFLQQPANLKASSLEQRLEAYAAQSDEARAAQARHALGTGSCRTFDQVASAACVLGLRDASRRLVESVFWPHFGPELAGVFREERQLASARLIHECDQFARAHQGLNAAAARHALAIAYHNLALAYEAAFCSGQIAFVPNYWSVSLGYWQLVIDDDAFWDYLRVRVLEGPGNQPGPDVARVRRALPRILVRVHARFSAQFAEAGEHVAAFRHLAYAGTFSESRPERAALEDVLYAAVESSYW